MMIIRTLPLVALLGLAACASPEARIRTGLVQQGLAEPLAGCMATQLSDRLSLGQLSRLNTLAKESRSPAGTVSVVQLADRLRLQDAEIAGVVASSGLRCAVVG